MWWLCSVGAVVDRQLRDGGGSEPSSQHAVQPLPAPLSGAEDRPHEPRVLRQTDPLRVLRFTHTQTRHKVHLSPHNPCCSSLPGTFNESCVLFFRGNSKYHYYGIRIKATSPLNQYTDEQTMAMRQQPVNNKRYVEIGKKMQ